MKYIINLTIVFDPEGRQLMLRNNNQLATGLSNPATRLLIELIKNNKLDLSREVLIKRVWEDYGYSPSNASLSNHISELRKSFESLGISKDIILTVPRMGFKMDADIHPETRHASESDIKTEVIGHENNVVEEKSQPSQPTDSKTRTGRKHTKVLIVICCLILITLASVAAVKVYKERNAMPVLAVQGKCTIYSVDNTPKNAGYLDSLKRLMLKEGIDCTHEESDVYYTEARQNNQLLKITFISVCPKNENGSYPTCNTYKFVE